MEDEKWYPQMEQQDPIGGCVSSFLLFSAFWLVVGFVIYIVK